MKIPAHTVFLDMNVVILASMDATRQHKPLAHALLGIASALEISHDDRRQPGSMLVSLRESRGPHDRLFVRIVTVQSLLAADVALATLAQVGAVRLRGGPRYVRHRDCGAQIRWSEWLALPELAVPGIADMLIPTRTCARCRSTISASKLEVILW